MDKQTKQVEDFFKQYTSQEANKICVDCGASNPLWASINNGVLICLACTSVHRTLGLQNSLVRSIQLDIWTDKQLALMENGGNIKFKEFLERYDLTSEDIKVKYVTKAAQYYRKRLAAITNTYPLNEDEPEYNEGRMLQDGKSLQSSSKQQDASTNDPQSLTPLDEEEKDVQYPPFEEADFSNQNLLEENKNGGQKGLEEEWTFKLKNRASTIIEKVQKVKASEIVEKAQTGGKTIFTKAETFTKETGTKVKNKMDDTGITEFAEKTAGKISTTGKLVGGFIADKAKKASSAVNEKIDNNEKLSKARDVTKEKVTQVGQFVNTGIMSLWSKLKKDPKKDEKMMVQNNLIEYSQVEDQNEEGEKNEHQNDSNEIQESGNNIQGKDDTDGTAEDVIGQKNQI